MSLNFIVWIIVDVFSVIKVLYSSVQMLSEMYQTKVEVKTCCVPAIVYSPTVHVIKPRLLMAFINDIVLELFTRSPWRLTTPEKQIMPHSNFWLIIHVFIFTFGKKQLYCSRILIVWLSTSTTITYNTRLQKRVKGGKPLDTNFRYILLLIFNYPLGSHAVCHLAYIYIYFFFNYPLGSHAVCHLAYTYIYIYIRT
jgi:hypothetical protein